MLGIFKKKPLEFKAKEAETLTEIEGWIVKWGVLNKWDDTDKTFQRIFVSENDARLFEKRLIECSDVLKARIYISVFKNEI